ncbi:MAG: hypothetical protein LBJ64_11500, partial [Deltaproteobacteria bacterium]|nr:hypothetical protein [Deltaproteobacteria bacterium]
GTIPSPLSVGQLRRRRTSGLNRSGSLFGPVWRMAHRPSPPLPVNFNPPSAERIPIESSLDRPGSDGGS